MEEKQRAEAKKTHSLEYRSGTLKVNGVRDVKSFDDREIVLVLDNEKLTVRGTGLTVSELKTSEGSFSVDGRVISLTYSGGGGESLLKKIFK